MSSIDGENRFSAITPDNHAGSIWIASLLTLVYAVLTLGVRGHLRWRNILVDDCLAIAATVTQVGEVIAVIVALKHGLGQTQDLLLASDVSESSQATFSGQILFITSSTLAKAATLCLMMRLFNLNSPTASTHTRSPALLWWLCITILISIALWGVLSIIALSVDCSASHFIRAGSAAQCSNQLLRWRLITAFDVATEGVLVLFCVCIVWPVRLAVELKFQVVLAFAFRLVVAALSIVHLHYIAVYRHSTNPGLALVPVVVLRQVQLCWSLISATIPSLKAFVKSFSSGFGIQLDPYTTQAYGSQRTYGRTDRYELGSVKGNGTLKSRPGNRSGNRSYHDTEERGSLPVQMQPQYSKKRNTRDEESINSLGSQEHIIRKEVEWQVHYENDPQ